VIAGIVGARLYHDLTSWNQDPAIHEHWWGFAAVWQGGLGIWGAIPFGLAAGAFVVKRSGSSVTLFMDAVAPGLLLAQGIGRWGNYWNQELYGRPTSLPWALRIDQAHQAGIQDRYRSTGQFGYYQPTFLYESLWDLIGVGMLLLVDRRFRIRPPALFCLYVSWYTFGRTFEELLRVDPSHHFLGERINFWVSLLVFLASTTAFVWLQFLRPRAGAAAPGRVRPQS